MAQSALASPEEEFFVFAGKIYSRSRDDLYTPSYRAQQKIESAARLALSVAPLVAIAAYVWSMRLVVPLSSKSSKKNKQESGESEDGEAVRLPRTAKHGEKIVYASSGLEGIWLRYASGNNMGGEEQGGDTTTLASRPDVKSQLKELSAALSSMSSGSGNNAATASISKGLTEAEFEILRATIIKQRNPKLLREEIVKLQTRIGVNPATEKLRLHPLTWSRSTSKYVYDQDLVELAASVAIPLSALSPAVSERCSRCETRGEMVTPLLSVRRHSAFYDLACRDFVDDELERLVWLILRTKERPEEVFLEEDPIRLVEPPAGKWYEVNGTSWQHDFALGSSSFAGGGIRYFPPETVSKQPADTLVRLIETCLLSGAAEDETKERLMVSCAAVDSSSSPRRLYGFRGVRFDRYDVIVDITRQEVYFNTKTYCGSSAKLQRLVLAILNGLGTDRFALAKRVLRRNSTALKTLLGSSSFVETWVCTMPASCIAKPDKKSLLAEIKKTVRKELGVPSHASIGCCIGSLTEAPMIGSYSLMNDMCVVWISPMVPPSGGSDPLSALLGDGEDNTQGTTTVLVFVKDRALCGCSFQKALNKACGGAS